jgi:hypothetical protein
MANVPTPLGNEMPNSPLEAEMSGHLNAICASEAFKNSSTLKNLLCYLFYNRTKQLSEYMLAVEALGRREDFDPQVDATVRVQISRLRRRLKDFYLSEGRSLPLRFCIPLGSHQLVLDEGQNAPARQNLVMQPSGTVNAPVPGLVQVSWPRVVSEPLIEKRIRPSMPVVLLACLSILLIGVCGWQFYELGKQRQALVMRPAPATLLPLWQEFTANGRPIQIVIPNPTFFSWHVTERGTLMGRDTTVNNFMDRDKAPELKMLDEKYGKPSLSQHYAVSSDVIASLKLLHYMDAGLLKADLAISSDAPWEAYENDNIILLGTPGTLTPFKSQLDRLYFWFDPQGFVIRNRQPRAGEPATYSGLFESETRFFRPGLIAVLPGVSKDSRIMILAGQSTAALVSFLTSKNGNDQLQKMQRQNGGGPYFEAVILSEQDGDTVLNNRLVALRTYPATWSHN